MSLSAPTSPFVESGATFTCLHQAVTGYVKQTDGELTVRQGDIIASVKDLGNGWSLGKNISNGNQSGIFPSGSVQALSIFVPAANLGSMAVGAGLGMNFQSSFDQSYQMLSTSSPDCLEPNQHPRDGSTTSVKMEQFEGPSDRNDPIEQAGQTYEQLEGIVADFDRGAPVRGLNEKKGSTFRPAAMTGQSTEFVRSAADCGQTPASRRITYWKKPWMIVKPNLEKNEGSSGTGGSLEERRPARVGRSADSDSTTATNRLVFYTSRRHQNPLPHCQFQLATLPHATSAGNLNEGESGIMTTPSPTTAMLQNQLTETRLHGATSTNTPPQNYPTRQNSNVKSDDSFDTVYGLPEFQSDQGGRFTSVGTDKSFYKLLPTSDEMVCERSGSFYDEFCRDRGDVFFGRRPRNSRTKRGRFCRLVTSVLAGQLIGLMTFLWMFYGLGYGLLMSASVCATVATILSISFALSRLCRCTAAILVPSIGTTRGRLAFLILISGFLLDGPATNVYLNLEEVSRSMGCSTEQSYKQAMFFIKPFDSLIAQLNGTVAQLHNAAVNVRRGLRPLDDGLGLVEMDIYNGRLQLFGTRKVS